MTLTLGAVGERGYLRGGSRKKGDSRDSVRGECVIIGVSSMF